MTVRSESTAKIRFELESEAWHGSATETLWAEQVGRGRYRLRNSPFFAFGVSAEDVVFAGEEDEGGAHPFVGVSLRGGHSTYRIMRLADDERLIKEYWQPLEDLGCTYEEGRVLAVDVPPTTDIYDVYPLLEAGEAQGAWHFEEGHCGHPLRDTGDAATVDSS